MGRGGDYRSPQWERLTSPIFSARNRAAPNGPPRCARPRNRWRPGCVPRRLSEVVGQEHLLKPGSLLPRLVAQNRFGSLLFYGPPGCGKTSIAEAIARETNSRFVRVNAVMSNVAELREILATARRRPEAATDPLHRRTAPLQQVAAGPAAAGRRGGQCPADRRDDPQPRLLRQSAAALAQPPVPARAAVDPPPWPPCCGRRWRMPSAASGRGASRGRQAARRSRRAVRTATCGARSIPSKCSRSACRSSGTITAADLEVFARERRIRYDADEDEHYDTISAFIKSCRGSDPDAALYWLAKMLAGGEDPRFIARRLVILASEDVGPGRSPGAAAHRGGAPCGGFHRPARGRAHPGACDALHRDGAEEQFRHARARRGAPSG
jgi:putative ATPase